MNQRGYGKDIYESLLEPLKGGSTIACTAYSHLSHQPTQIYTALYTAFLIHFDDITGPETSHLYAFNHFFIQREPQGNIMLEAFDNLLRETRCYFNDICASIIITSTLDWFSARMLEDNSSNIHLMPNSLYPLYSRAMSGNAEAFALFVFPSEIAWQDYIHVLPDISNFVNDAK
ncbi:hypothetical protein EV368DRAFT_89922 [Lentinula lateritia]|nr:hypothetical protein EV368DRAFT_89922 [Lentinula lateritia]